VTGSVRLARIVAAAALVAFLFIGCNRVKSAGQDRLPAGDAVWFEDGTAEGAGDTELLLTRGGFGSVFLPASALTRDGDRWKSTEAEPPGKPFVRLPAHLVISASEDAKSALADPRTAAALGDAVWLAAKAALRDAPRFAPLRGIHLDVPFAPANAEAYGALLRSIREKLPKETLLTWSLRFTPSETEREALRKMADAADGAVAFVFGELSAADPMGTDQLDHSWLAAYFPAARGHWTSGNEAERMLPEIVLSSLTNDPRVEFSHDLSLKDEAASAFLLTPHQALAIRSFRFKPGDRIQFRQPSLSDMVYRFGADLAGRRFVRGRVVALSGRTEADRIFTLAALNDILLGRPLNTDLRVTVTPARGLVSISAENPTPHASLVSRTSNWVEIEIPGGGITDVRAGGFDRYEMFGAEGAAVTLGRATRLRFFETLVGPWEKIEAARIVLRKPPPRGCCGHRIHVLSSAGAEISREGDEAAVSPTPARTTK
jgi:predicted small secreted protein